MMRVFLTSLPFTILPFAVGCATTKPVSDPAARDRMLALLLPAKVEIIAPFTRVKSFDDDSVPDGIELWLQAVNSLGNTGLNIVGSLRAELYEYVPASAEHKGRRLEQWKIELATPAHQRAYWSDLTRMYEFRLMIDPATVPLAKQYVLAVTYTTPLGEHLTDECVLTYDAGLSLTPGAVGRSG